MNSNNIPVRFFAAAAKKGPATKPVAEKTRAAVKLPKRVITQRDGEAWLKTEGKRYDNLTTKNWLHPERPFPKNPWFVPPPPTGDMLREKIYADYRSDPVTFTPRRLAEKHELSVIRVEAILRLKHLEKKQQQQGYVLQSKYAKQMERLLGVGGNNRIVEEADGSSYKRPTVLPAFRLDDPDELTEDSITETEASSESVKEPKVEGHEETFKITKDLFKRRLDGNYIMQLSGVIHEPEPEPIVISQDDKETDRKHTYIIADLSKGSDITCYVREKTGTLRTATRAETKMHTRLFPLKKAQDLMREKVKDLWDI